MVSGKPFKIRMRIVVLYSILILIIIVSLLNKFSNRNAKNFGNIEKISNSTLDIPTLPKLPKTKIDYQSVKALEKKEFTIDPDEKFLAYHTHSGYHNQRISLENALLLAKILNRTLLMPPVLLGRPLPWASFDKMYDRLFLSTKKGLNHCSKVSKAFPLPAECLNYNSYTTVSWDFLLNMEPIRKSQKTIDLLDHSYEWIENNLNLSIYNDTTFIKDKRLWDYRIFDVFNSNIDHTNRFSSFIYADTLKEDSHKLIHLGSLFGAFRVVPEKPYNLQYLKFIRKHLLPNNPLVLKAANSIVNKLSGVNKFIGIHIRATDGFFMKFAKLNIDYIYHNLTDTYTKLTPKEIDVLEGGTHEQDILIDESVDLGKNNPYYNKTSTDDDNNNNNNNNNNQLKEKDLKNDDKLNKSDSQNIKNNDKIKNIHLHDVKCKRSLHPSDSGVNSVIFIATDIKLPRSSPLLFKFFNTFPCAFVLGDFEEDLREISKVINEDDLTPLAEYLIPMLDALISSRGYTFYGTIRSTFSKYIRSSLHPISKGREIEIPLDLS